MTTLTRPMTDPFFGELYLRSTLPFLSEATTSLEIDFLKAHLPQGRLLDVGCGHGRHLRAFPTAVGIDFDPTSLVEARGYRPVARADFKALPFRAASFQGAWSWYNTLATFEPSVTAAFLREVSGCLEPGATFVVQGSHPGRAIEKPHARWDGPLPNGCFLHEVSTWSPSQRRDDIVRQLTLPDGRVMTAEFFIHYYALDEWRALLAQAGLQVSWACGAVDGRPLADDSPDVIVGAEKRGH